MTRSTSRALRRLDEGAEPRWSVPQLPADAATPRRFPVTIADLGSFAAATFPAQLEAWCRATLESLGQPTLAAWCRSNLFHRTLEGMGLH